MKKNVMKIIVNKCFGGFCISKECAEYMEKLGDEQAKQELDDWRKQKSWLDEFLQTGKWNPDAEGVAFLEIDAKYNSGPTFHGYGYGDKFRDGYSRTNPNLIKAVKKLGKKASGAHAELKIVDIPDDVDWEIDEYDGLESIHEKHRVW